MANGISACTLTAVILLSWVTSTIGGEADSPSYATAIEIPHRTDDQPPGVDMIERAAPDLNWMYVGPRGGHILGASGRGSIVTRVEASAGVICVATSIAYAYEDNAFWVYKLEGFQEAGKDLFLGYPKSADGTIWCKRGNDSWIQWDHVKRCKNSATTPPSPPPSSHSNAQDAAARDSKQQFAGNATGTTEASTSRYSANDDQARGNYIKLMNETRDLDYVVMAVSNWRHTQNLRVQKGQPVTLRNLPSSGFGVAAFNPQGELREAIGGDYFQLAVPFEIAVTGKEGHYTLEINPLE